MIFRSASALPIWLAWLSATAAAVQLLSFESSSPMRAHSPGTGCSGFIPLGVALVTVAALSALLTAWAREAARPGGIGITDRIRGGVTGAVTGAAAGVRGERTTTQRPPQ